MTSTMASWLAENLAVWPDRLPAPTTADAAHIRLEDGAPHPAVLLRCGDDWLTLHGRRDPVAEADRLLTKIGAGDSRLLFAIGLGLGYCLDALERRDWDGRVVAFEPEPALLPALLGRRDWRPWLSSGRLAILQGPSYEGIDDITPTLNPKRPEPVIAVNPVLARSRPEAVRQAFDVAARAWAGARANQEARREHAARYLLNTLCNVPAIASEGDVAALENVFSRVPAVVIGAGPSLDRNLPDLVRDRDRALLVAVDTALRPLLSAGVQPDLVVAVDPGEANARHLVDLPPCPGTHLVTEGSLDPEALRPFAGRTFFFRVADHHPWPWLRTLGLDRALLRAWGSVLTTAFDLARVMGCDPIVFAGADLAFTDGRPYARGTTYEENWSRERQQGVSTEAIWARHVAEWPELWETSVRGEPSRTAAHLRSFRDWIVTQAGKATDRTIINGTGAGILVGPQVAQVSLRAALASVDARGERVGSRIVAAHRVDAVATERLAAGLDEIGRAARAGGSSVLTGWLEFGGANLGGLDAVLGALGKQQSASAVPSAADEPRRLEDLFPDLVRTADADVVAAYASAARPLRIMLCGSGALPFALAALLAAGPQSRLDVTCAADQAHDRDAVDALGVRHRVDGEAGSAVPAPLVVLGCADPGLDFAAEMERAWRVTAEGGRLLIVDRTMRPSGPVVRRALFEFLERHAEVKSRYERLYDPDSNLVWIESRASTATALAPDLDKFDPGYEVVAEQLAPVLAAHFTPRSVLDVGCGAGYCLRAFEAQGITDVRGIEASDLIASSGMLPARGVTACDLATFQPSGRVDLVLCLCVLQRVPPGTAEALVGACTKASDTVVFSMAAPGFDLPKYINDRPWRVWHRLFGRHGFVASDELRPLVDARAPSCVSPHDLLIVYRRVADEGAARCGSSAEAERMLAAMDRIGEQLLERDWYIRTLDRATGHGMVSAVTNWQALELPPARLESGGVANVRLFRFRPSTPLLGLSGTLLKSISVREDGRLLRRASSVERVRNGPPGVFAIDAEAIVFSATDHSDPRRNGRTYAVSVPAQIAALERFPPGPRG